MKTQLINIHDDLDEIKKIVEGAFSSTPDSSIGKWFSFKEMTHQITSHRGVCIKAVSDDEKILGIIYAQQENPINGAEGLEKWVIVLTAVDSTITGQGIGSILLKEIEHQALEKGAIKIFVYTNKNDANVIHFYKKNGYEDAGWIKDYQYGKGNSATFLIKFLQ